MKTVNIFVFPEDVYEEHTEISVLGQTRGYHKVDSKMKLKFFLLENETIRDISGSSAIDPIDTRGEVDKNVKAIMKKVDQKLLADQALSQFPSVLRSTGNIHLYEPLVPERLKNALQEAIDQNGDQRPVLNIYMHEDVDWIPWELMHDKQDFLGLRFLIARHPLVSTAPSLNNGQPRVVRKILNLLGKNLYPEDGNGINDWKETFSAVKLPKIEAHHLCTFPDEISDWSNFPSIQDLWEPMEHDIVHLICHGKTKDGDYCWTLDHEGEAVDYEINAGNIRGFFFDLDTNHPLVFGNACGSTAALAEGHLKGLGPTCLNLGASAYIGTLAPITRSMAPKFAAEFFRQLLHEELPIGEALMATKESLQGSTDPSWLFYCLYGSPDTCFVLE